MTAPDLLADPASDEADDTAPTTTHARATVRPDKAQTVAEMAQAFQDASASILTEYRGLTVTQISRLRVALGADTTYSVVKNTLTKLAAADAGLTGLDEFLSGPTAVAFIGGEPVEAAKVLRDYARTNPALIVKGGVLDGKPLTADEVRRLADLESREVLLAKMAGAMTASLSQAVYLLNAPLAQAARLAAALLDKAEQDPTVLAGAAGSAPTDASISGDASAAAPGEGSTAVGGSDDAAPTDGEASVGLAADIAPVEAPTDIAPAEAPTDVAPGAADASVDMSAETTSSFTPVEADSDVDQAPAAPGVAEQSAPLLTADDIAGADLAGVNTVEAEPSPSVGIDEAIGTDAAILDDAALTTTLTASTDPGATDPGVTDPAGTESVAMDSAQTDPDQTDPYQTEHAQTDPA